MRVGYMLAKKRYAHADVLKWALQKFPEYDGVELVIRSCYKNTPGASEKSSGGGGGGNGGSDNRFASVEEIRNFLDGHIRLRYNLITQRYEFLEIPKGASLSSDKPPRLEQELVDLYFRKPSEGETGEFVSVARAMQIIGCTITQKLSSQKIGKAFSDLDFKKSRTKHSRGGHRHHPHGRRDSELSDFPGYRCQQQSSILMTGDGGDTCFLKLSSRGQAGKIFQKGLPPAYVREISGKACHRCHPVTRM